MAINGSHTSLFQDVKQVIRITHVALTLIHTAMAINGSLNSIFLINTACGLMLVNTFVRLNKQSIFQIFLFSYYLCCVLIWNCTDPQRAALNRFLCILGMLSLYQTVYSWLSNPDHWVLFGALELVSFLQKISLFLRSIIVSVAKAAGICCSTTPLL